MTAANIILAVRQDVKDAAKSNIVRGEVPSGDVDAVNKRFYLAYQPIVTASAKVYQNGTLLTLTTNYTIDEETGIITFVAIPAVGTKIEVDYYYNWFNDASYTSFLDNASQSLGFASATITSIPEGLIPATLKFVAHYYYKARAAFYANRFNSSTAGQTVNVDVITKNFKDLATECWEEAIELRNDYYKKFGQQNQPASAVTAPSISNYTPQR